MEILLAAQVSDEANCAFNESFRLVLQGPLDTSALESAWRALLDRHEALRMSLVPSGDRMQIDRQRNIPIDRVNLAEHAPKTQQEWLDRLIAEEGAQPFDLVHGPLLRAQLVTLAPDGICFWSPAPPDLRWLGRQYHHRRARQALFGNGSKPAGGPSHALPFSRYAMDVQTPAWREHQKRDLEYWKQRMTPLPELLTLPADRNRPTTRSFAGSTFVAEFPKDFGLALRKAGATAGCTLFTTLLAGWQILLWRLSGNADPVTMIPAAAQSQIEDKVLVGHCVHLLPVRASLDPQITAVDYLRALKPWFSMPMNIKAQPTAALCASSLRRARPVGCR